MGNINLNPCRRGATILPDQLNNLLQNEVSLWGPEPGHKRLHDKAANIPMNPVPAARADMPIHSRLHVVGRHVIPGSPKHVIQDYDESYDVGHHASNILLANIRGRLRLDQRRLSVVHSPASIYVRNPIHGAITTRNSIVKWLGSD